MSEKNISSKYTSLDDLSYFRTGNIIIDDTLFLVDKGTIIDSYQLSGETIEEKVREARIQAELGNRKRVVVDTEGVYDESTVADEGELITNSESFNRLSEEEREDYESFAEHYLNM